MVGSNYLFLIMFWTILAMMLVLLYSLKQVVVTQRFIRNIDENIEKIVRKIEREEERILTDIEKKKRK